MPRGCSLPSSGISRTSHPCPPASASSLLPARNSGLEVGQEHWPQSSPFLMEHIWLPLGSPFPARNLNRVSVCFLLRILRVYVFPGWSGGVVAVVAASADDACGDEKPLGAVEGGGELDATDEGSSGLLTLRVPRRMRRTWAACGKSMLSPAAMAARVGTPYRSRSLPPAAAGRSPT
jgi:hypothetical protein